MRNKYFTEAERYQLEALLKSKTPKTEIAKILDKSRTTIYNEIKRGTVEFMDSELRHYFAYDAEYAQNDYIQSVTNKGRALKIGNDMEFVHYVEEKINKDKYSPYAVLESIKQEDREFRTDICLSTLYNYLRSGMFLNISYKTKRSKEYKRKVSLKNPTALSIEKRPEDVKTREKFGHWELDTVVSGRGGKGCLMVLTERKTRNEIIRKIPDKSAMSVVRAITSIEKEMGTETFKETFKTISCDNGTEFSDTTGIETSIDNTRRTTVYYCHPYCAFERGSNENQNRMIRRFIPKGSDISQYTDEYIAYVQNWINSYPRRLFNGLSSLQMLQKCV